MAKFARGIEPVRFAMTSVGCEVIKRLSHLARQGVAGDIAVQDVHRINEDRRLIRRTSWCAVKTVKLLRTTETWF